MSWDLLDEGGVATISPTSGGLGAAIIEQSSRRAGTPSFSASERRWQAVISLQRALLEALDASNDDRTASPPHPDAFLHSLEVINHLPVWVPLPDIGVDVDGDIALEWDRGSRRLFSLRVSKDGTLYYSRLIGHETDHGSKSFRGGVPIEVLRGIEAVISGHQV